MIRRTTNAEMRRDVISSRPRWKGVVLAAALACGLSTMAGTSARTQTVWQAALPVRPSAGGLEAERGTWVCERRKFEQTVERSGQQWTIKVAGDCRHVRVTLEWEERKRAPGLGERAADWGWDNEPRALSRVNEPAALPAITTGSAGTLYAVYSVGQPSSRRVAYRQYRNGDWGPEIPVTTPGQDANHPVAAEDSAGTLWVAYQVGGLWKGGDVYVVPVRAGNASEPERMNTTDARHVAFFPSITVHGRSVAVSWEGGQVDKDEKTEWGTEVGSLRLYDGSGWGAPALMKGQPFINLGLPKVYYDPRGRLHLTATKGPRYYINLSEKPAAFQWLTPDWTYHSRGASLTADRGGDVWAVFDGQNSGTTNEIYLRMLPASAPNATISNWTQTLRISEDDKRPSIYPDLVAEDATRLVVVWMDYRHKNAEVYGKVFLGGRWSPDLLISAPADEKARRAAETMTPNQILWASPEGLQSEYPHLARAADGTIWVVWQESIDGKPHRVMARPFHWPDVTARQGRARGKES